MALSADTLRRYVKHVAKCGTSERGLRDERSGSFDPEGCSGVGRVPQHGLQVSEVPGSHMRPRPRLCAGRSWDSYAEYIDRRMAEGLDCRVLDREVQTLGCQGSYSTVVQYVRPRRQRKQPEATMRFETEPGEQVQVDCLAHLPSTEALISWSDTTRATHPVSAHCNCS